jgi:CheY-like chemotaxis protein
VRLGLAETSGAPLELQPAETQSGTGRILVVDDEPGVAEMIGDILEGAGYSVDIRTDARAALEILETRPFDAILSDIKMPGLDGPGFYSAVLEQDPKLARRIGFVTGDTLTPSVSTFLTGSGQPHLEKPIAPDELLTLVAGLIEQQGALKS